MTAYFLFPFFPLSSSNNLFEQKYFNFGVKNITNFFALTENQNIVKEINQFSTTQIFKDFI